jgi:hypothetical protein
MERKGKIIRGFKSKAKKKCNFGVNKNTGKCLKYPRKK